MVIGTYKVGVTGTVTEVEVNAAPVKLAVVVVLVGVVATEKFAEYFAAV